MKRTLHVATPQNSKLEFLRREGLIAPSDIDPESDELPFDFTRLSSREIGAAHSRYAVRHAHAIYVAAVRASDLAKLKRDLRLAQAKFRVRHQGGKKYELDDAMMRDKEIKKLTIQIATVEAEKDLIDAIALGFEDFRNAASREMFRRSSEQAPRD